MLDLHAQDTRPKKEYTVSHIPGAVQVDPDTPEPWKLVDTCRHSQGELDGLVSVA